MTERSQRDQDLRELMLRLLPMSASLAGLCIAAVTLFRTSERLARFGTVADDLVVVCAALFMTATYLTFWALHSAKPGLMKRLSSWIDKLFLAGLTAMVGVGFLMVYTLF